MKFRFKKIRTKLMLLITIVSLVTYILCISYVIIKFRQKAVEKAKDLAHSYTIQNANEAKSQLNKDLGMARAIASTIALYQNDSVLLRETTIDKILTSVLYEDERYYSTWVSLELNAFEPSWGKPYGRKRFTYYRVGGEPSIDSVNLDGDLIGSTYFRLKTTKKEEINDPYYFSLYNDSDDERNNIFGTSVCVPLLIEGQFAGLAGMDMSLDNFNYITQIKPFENANTFLVANNGTFVAYENMDLIGKSISDIFKEEYDPEELLKKISKGESFSFETKETLSGEKSLISFYPIDFGDSELPWAIGTVVPINDITAEVNQILFYTILTALLGLSLLVLVLWFVSNNITRPLDRVTTAIKNIAAGDIELENRVNIKSKDEIAEIGKSVNLLIEGLNEKASFAGEIGQGKFDSEFNPISDQDTLGISLVNMRKNLKTSAEEEKRRNWVTEGLAKFADILRIHTDDVDEFYQRIVSHISDYVEANQCGLFVLNDEEKANPHLELVSAYAYERKKFLEKKVSMGQGLVGQCFLEKSTIYMTNVPNDYVNITSGLGGSNPNSILIVPIILNEEVYGVLELVSFKTYEEYEIEFIEKIAESLASTISSMSINLKTRELLEESQQQSEEMRSQEEEMRQNLEEMEATQEELRRKNLEVERLLNEGNEREKHLNDTIEQIEQLKLENDEKSREALETSELFKNTLLAMIDKMEQSIFLKDTEGRFILANSALAKNHGISVEDLLGKSDFDFHPKEVAQEYRNKELRIIKSGKALKIEEDFENAAGEKKIILSVKMPFFIDYLNEEGLLGIQTDVTEMRRLEADLERRKNDHERLNKNAKN
ncbi:GAF domain-containing protein [Fulvivirgaceae bacterium BMA10]|uniref:histidine kinase n=1 Tax=Splendidivirga corallicola TaxID=3051826 RepID=A0ABT8KJ62_9BACT|nr:GAF domain-containing protein [Fulvivirgaceae bacterium BMA10]